MLSVTNDFKTALTQPRQIDAKVVVNGSTTLTSSQINSIRREFSVGLFKSVLKKVTIDSNVVIDKDDVVVPSMGIYVNNDYEYLSLGSFKPIEPPNLNKDTKSYEISTYDAIVDCMVKYALTSTDITYPCSVRDLFVAIFTKLGWATSGIPATFTNSTSQIEEDVYSNLDITYRDVLDELCTISCMFLIDKNGVPTLIQKTTTSETINEEFMKDTNVAVKDRVFFNSLVFARVEDSDNIVRKDDTSIANNGLHEFRVSNLQILSLNWRDNFIDAMWNYIKTFEYYSYEIDTIGIGYLEPIDEFTLSIFNDTYGTILLNDDLTIRDGISERIWSDKPEETQTEYKYASDTDKKINQTYIIVDKQNQEIEALVSKVDEEDTKISQLIIANDNIQTNVSTINDTLTERITTLQTSTSLQINAINQTLENGVETLTNNLVSIDINGINVSTNTSKISTIMTNSTFAIKDTSNTYLAYFGYDEVEGRSKAEMDNLTITNYLTTGAHRIEKYEDENTHEIRTGYFYVGGGD